MTEAKIEFKLGAIEFSGEGEKAWISEQLDKILLQAPALLALAPVAPSPSLPIASAGGSHTPMQEDASIANQTLVTFLKEKNASKSQVRKFLATAIWLEAKGKKRLGTADITQALKDSNQSRLSNPADCLNQNVAKGFCEKDGNQFFVTTEGKNSL
jgi:hypothetical protein